MSKRLLAAPLVLFAFTACGFRLNRFELAEIEAEQPSAKNAADAFTVRDMLVASQKLMPLPAGWKPSPLYPLKKPVISKTVDGNDVSGLPGQTLRLFAKAAFHRKAFSDAIVFCYWATITNPDDYYQLACYSAVAEDNEAGFYWLQQAAIHSRIDAVRADQEGDLIALRRDERWTEFLEWLLKCQTYHNQIAKPLTSLILPVDYNVAQKQELNVVVWLHGLGGSPDNFVNPKQKDTQAQYFADYLNLAFVGVSGPICIGKNSYVWAENDKEDLERIKSALDELKGKVNIKPAGLIAFGFSQGGQVGMELAARYPEEFAGAIVLSPGAISVNLEKIDRTNPLLKRRGFVFGCGERESFENLRQAETGYLWAKNSGADALRYFYPGQSQHTLPKDFFGRFPEWIKFIRIANKSF